MNRGSASTILDEIVESKRKEVARLKRNTPLEELRRKTRERSPRLRNAFDQEGLHLIAEIKPKAPSSGNITKLPAQEIARIYQQEKVSAVSCLTDEPYFGQSLNTISLIKNVLQKPILRKDFIIDPYQVHQTAASGADALLLIASIVSPGKLESLYHLTEKLEMDALVEVHSLEEWEDLPITPRILGINNRTLDGDFTTDLSVTEKLAPEIPDDLILISESGIQNSEDVDRLRAIPNLDGILVGTSLLKDAEDLETIRSRVRRLIGF